MLKIGICEMWYNIILDMKVNQFLNVISMNLTIIDLERNSMILQCRNANVMANSACPNKAASGLVWHRLRRPTCPNI